MKMHLVALVVMLSCLTVTVGIAAVMTTGHGPFLAMSFGTIANEGPDDPPPTPYPTATPVPTAELTQAFAALDAGASMTFQQAQDLMRWLEDQRPVNKRIYRIPPTPSPTLSIEQEEAEDDAFAANVEGPFKEKLLKCRLARSQGWVEVAGETYQKPGTYAAYVYVYDPHTDYLPQKWNFVTYGPSNKADVVLQGLTARQADELKPGQKIEFDGTIAGGRGGSVALKDVRYTLLPADPVKTTRLSNADRANLEISYQSTRCNGMCPAYKMTITGDGILTFEGKSDTKVSSATVSLSGEQVAALLQAFDQADFLSLHDDYPLDFTDASSTITCIGSSVGSKCVRHDHSSFTAPRRLLILENQIEQMTNVQQWTK